MPPDPARPSRPSSESCVACVFERSRDRRSHGPEHSNESNMASAARRVGTRDNMNGSGSAGAAVGSNRFWLGAHTCARGKAGSDADGGAANLSAFSVGLTADHPRTGSGTKHSSMLGRNHERPRAKGLSMEDGGEEEPEAGAALSAPTGDPRMHSRRETGCSTGSRHNTSSPHHSRAGSKELDAGCATEGKGVRDKLMATGRAMQRKNTMTWEAFLSNYTAGVGGGPGAGGRGVRWREGQKLGGEDSSQPEGRLSIVHQARAKRVRVEPTRQS